MVATQPLGGFIWGAGGQMLTPQEAERQRRLAEALMAKGSDYSPVGSPMEGMARVANALVGGLKQYKANAAEKRGIESANTDTVNAFGGGFDSLGAGSAAPTSVPATYTSGTATKPPESAQEFISMMTPAALEVSKQTGLDPRLVIAQSALETGWGKSAPGNNFFGIKSHGKDGGNTLATTEVVNGQPVKVNDSFRAYGDPTESAMDYAAFLKSNPRYRDMLGAKGLDAQIAALGASGYATDPNYADKVRSIATGLPPLDGIVDHGEAAGADPSALAFAPVQTTPPAALQAIQDNAARPMVQQPVPGDAEALAQAEPAADVSVVPLPQARPAAPVAPQNRMARVAQLMGGPVAVPDADPMHSNLQQSAGDFARASAAQRAGIPQPVPQQPTGILTGRSVAPGIIPQPQPGIIPQGNPQQSRIAALAAVANNQFATPQVRALAVQQIQALTEPMKPVEVNGRLVDPRTGRVIADFSDGGKAPTVTDFYDPKTGQPYKAQWNPKTQTWEQVGGVKAPNGTSLTVGPDGQVSFVQGSGMKPPTEAQSKDMTFITRAAGALPVLDRYADHLTKFGEGTGGKVPLVGNYLKSDEYQQAEQAGREFLQAILRKDTGAAITKEETAEYGTVYLPQPGDGAAVLAQKREARHRALKAIEMGLPPERILMLEKAGVDISGGNAMPESPAAATNDPTPRPTSKAEYDALPSGTKFMDPNGQMRVKP